MDLLNVESDAMLWKMNFVQYVDMEIVIFLKAYIANPGNWACIIRDIKANLELIQERNLGPYSLTILRNVLSLVLQIFLYSEAFEYNKTSDWLNRRLSDKLNSLVSKLLTDFTYLDIRYM